MLKRMKAHECEAISYVYQYLKDIEEIVWPIHINKSIDSQDKEPVR